MNQLSHLDKVGNMDETKYECPNCGCTFLSDYIYCPECKQYTTASGMIERND